MACPEIASLIAEHLGTGLPHPGRPETDEAPRLLPLPPFRTAGLDEQRRRHAEDTALCIGEAVVNLIELKGYTIIPTKELDELRTTDRGPGAPLPVKCTGCKETIIALNVTNGRAMLDPSLIGQANLICPHNTAEAVA
jgi:hypothetical protein